LSLYAALNTRTGEVVGQTAGCHTSREFLNFPPRRGDAAKGGQDIHVILDNLSAHKTQQVQAYLAFHPQARLPSTPTSSSRLNHIDLWLSKILRHTMSTASSHPCRICRGTSASTLLTTTASRSRSLRRTRIRLGVSRYFGPD
jgi:hypothetical protein